MNEEGKRIELNAKFIAARGGNYELTRLQRAAVHHKPIMEGTKMAATEMTKGKVIKILMYYRNIDNEIRINKCIADDLELSLINI